MRLTSFVYHLSICTMTFLFPYSMFEQKVYSSHIGVTQCGIFCWPFSNLFVLLITKTGRLFYVVNDPWTCPWLEESLGVYWISSFVLKYAFFWLSALSDHVDLCCIECDNSASGPQTDATLHALLGWNWVPSSASSSVGCLVNTLASVVTAGIEVMLLF